MSMLAELKYSLRGIDYGALVRTIVALVFAGALPIIVTSYGVLQSFGGSGGGGSFFVLPAVGFGVLVPFIAGLVCPFAMSESMEKPWRKLGKACVAGWLGSSIGVAVAGCHESAVAGHVWVIDRHVITQDGFYRFALRHRVEMVRNAWAQDFARIVVAARTSDGVAIECEVTGTSYVALLNEAVAHGGRLDEVSGTIAQAWLVAGVQAAVATCQYDTLTPERCSRLSLEASQIAFSETRKAVPFAEVRWSLDIRNVRPVVST